MRSSRFMIFAKITILLILTLIPIYSLTYPVYASSCDNQSLNITRLCSQKDNATEYLLSLKKGGTNVLSTSDYDKSFFLCEEYTFDCGYVQDQNESVSIANGIQLKMTNAQVDTILPTNATLASTLKHYLNLAASEAKCGMKVFPLTLTSAQSDLFFTNYMTQLITNITAKYASQRSNGTLAWTDININIKTAICQAIKQDNDLLYSTFWDNLKANQFAQMSDYLKQQYIKTNQLYYIRSAYLIDSVTQRCNKYQSVSFLVDQSGSIGTINFQLAKDFLTHYLNSTYDDPKLTQIHFYDSAFQSYLEFGHTKSQLLAGVNSKTYRGGGTNTGDAINKTIDKILAANFDKGLNKVLIVITDGKSYDQVLAASNYARSKSITMISVGIGPAINEPQLLQISQTPSNMVKVATYADLGKLALFIQNFFCKQIINVKVNQTIVGNVVRVPQSPAYFRLQKSTKNQTYELKIKYQSNPDDSNQQIYRSEYDPFPDQFTEYNINQSYRISLLERVYFVTPMQQTQIRVKKNYQKVQTFSNSYVSVGGNNMKFNISLNQCTSASCSYEKASYQAIGSQKDVSPLNGKNYNIYGIIAGSIAALICLSLLGALALKKMTGSDQDQQEAANSGDDKLQPELTQQDISDENDLKSNHSQDSHKMSHKSNKGAQKSHLISKPGPSNKPPKQNHTSNKSEDDMDSRKSGHSVRKKNLKTKKK